MPAKSTTQPNARCWVWFRGGLNEQPHWRAGWYGAPSVLGGIRIEHSDFVPCRCPEWRVLFEEPQDLKQAPEIPEAAEWKLFPTDPNGMARDDTDVDAIDSTNDDDDDAEDTD